ncbi:MAG TPA: HEAT repeat domain-containing protein [Bryobacteraceae bacterium]|jgi:HEAT repeat protein|nr:HEAT repeat domain-containing protein [Bryobacteraceae bacterium]
MIRETTLAVFLLAGCACAQDLSIPMAESFQAGQNSDPDYQKGITALDAHDWDQAISRFDSVADRKGTGADAALYWKAYAQDHAGRPEESLSTIAALRRQYPSSRWLKDAQAIEVEVRAQTGSPVNPGAQPDQELKLVAVNSLLTSDPQTALPILQKLLASNNSLALKDRALFILTQTNLPEARKTLSSIARDSRNRDLQFRAIRYMGMQGNDDSRKELTSIYESSPDKEIRQQILKSFMISGSRSLLLQVAKSEKDPELRREAIRNLALAGGHAELAALYTSDASVEDRRDILKSMFLSGDSSKLIEIARNEKDPGLRAEAIKSLGLMGSNGRGDDLVAIYRSDTHPEVRQAVLKALFLQQNGKALVELARSEKDPAMKEEIVKKMALVHTKETTDYMMEILK